MRPRLSFEWLHACSGCEIALLNCGEQLLGLLDRVDIVHFPLLMDHKYQGGVNGEGEMGLPEAEIGLVSGGVANEEHLTVLRAMREKCRTLISFGTCATHGGIPALRNQWPINEALQTIFASGSEDGKGLIPTEVPAQLDRVYSIDEKVRVDVSLPGCPPKPEKILEVIEALLEHQSLHLTSKSVCETCPTVRTGKGQAAARRFLANAEYDPEEPVAQMRCLLEQGLLCMGPVTAGGCGGKDTPLCIRARVPCRGCYGPVRQGGNQLLDMMNALASNGIDHRGIIDRTSLLRFSGAHGLLKPVRKRT
jgi:F420-non-reducing hydrogenase small subunit